MFMGEYRHNIDAKGRMIIPARFRDELGNRFVVTRGLDGCLRTYTMAQWDAVFEQLKRLPSTKRETRMYIHMLTSKASECELDSQGRILLPAALITESGVADHVEIWAKERWDNYYDEASASFEDVAEQLTEFLV